MSEKIPVPGGYIEAEGPEDNRHTIYHKRILRFKQVHGTMTGNVCELECGHRVMTFGRIEQTEGRVLCMQCRDNAN